MLGLRIFFHKMLALALVIGVPSICVLFYSNFIQARERDPLVLVRTGDSQIAEARGKAQATLPEFLQHLRSPQPGETTFLVKFKLEASHAIAGRAPAAVQNEQDEFIWATKLSLQPRGKILLGFLDGTPRKAGFFSGQPVAIPLEDITDWGYRKDGVMQGNFTTRLLLTRITPPEAERVKRLMGWQ